jgi:hypothetical protein
MQSLFILFFVLKYITSQQNIVQTDINKKKRKDYLINQTLNSNANIKKNLILGVVETYSLYNILPFFKSLIHTNIRNCDIVMFVRKVSPRLINYLKSIRVFTYEIPQEYKNFSIVKLRWKLYIDFLKEKKNDYKLVLSVDVRDTFFQKDIFKFYENQKHFLGIAIEDGTLNEDYNKKWIIDFVGEKMHKTIQNERIICAGTIWGTLDKFLELAQILWDKLLINIQTTDQGIANYLFYHEKIFKDCLLKSDNYGPIMTIGLTESKKIILDEEDNVLNFNGEIASVIHQYDRNADIMIKVMNKYSPELLMLNEIKTNFFDSSSVKK